MKKLVNDLGNGVKTYRENGLYKVYKNEDAVKEFRRPLLAHKFASELASEVAEVKELHQLGGVQLTAWTVNNGTQVETYLVEYQGKKYIARRAIENAYYSDKIKEKIDGIWIIIEEYQEPVKKETVKIDDNWAEKKASLEALEAKAEKAELDKLNRRYRNAIS